MEKMISVRFGSWNFEQPHAEGLWQTVEIGMYDESISTLKFSDPVIQSIVAKGFEKVGPVNTEYDFCQISILMEGKEDSICYGKMNRISDEENRKKTAEYYRTHPVVAWVFTECDKCGGPTHLREVRKIPENYMYIEDELRNGLPQYCINEPATCIFCSSSY